MYEKNSRFDNELQVPMKILFGKTDKVMAWVMMTPKIQPSGLNFINPGIVRMFKFYAEYCGLGDDLSEALDKAETFLDGDYGCYVFKNEESVPVYEYEVVKGIGHSQTEDEARRAFAYFKNFSLGEDGVIVYDGEVKNTGITENMLPLDLGNKF